MTLFFSGQFLTDSQMSSNIKDPDVDRVVFVFFFFVLFFFFFFFFLSAVIVDKFWAHSCAADSVFMEHSICCKTEGGSEG